MRTELNEIILENHVFKNAQKPRNLKTLNGEEAFHIYIVIVLK